MLKIFMIILILNFLKKPINGTDSKSKKIHKRFHNHDERVVEIMQILFTDKKGIQICGEYLYYAVQEFCLHFSEYYGRLVGKRSVNPYSDYDYGIVDECCYRPCTLSKIIKYCS